MFNNNLLENNRAKNYKLYKPILDAIAIQSENNYLNFGI